MTPFEWFSIAQSVALLFVAILAWSARAGGTVGATIQRTFTDVALLKANYERLELRMDRAGRAASDLSDQVQTLIGDVRSIRELLTARIDTVKEDHMRIDKQIEHLLRVVDHHERQIGKIG